MYLLGPRYSRGGWMYLLGRRYSRGGWMYLLGRRYSRGGWMYLLGPRYSRGGWMYLLGPRYSRGGWMYLLGPPYSRGGWMYLLGPRYSRGGWMYLLGPRYSRRRLNVLMFFAGKMFLYMVSFNDGSEDYIGIEEVILFQLLRTLYLCFCELFCFLWIFYIKVEQHFIVLFWRYLPCQDICLRLGIFLRCY